MPQDKLVICPRCGSDACYKQEMGGDYEIHQCYGCGFTTNTLMTSESKFLEEQLEVLPELYKDLIHIDEKGYYWIPLAINHPEQGMIFADGNNIEDWGWSSVKAIKIADKDKEKYPIPGKTEEYYEYKMDMESLKKFKERDFIEALDYIGVFKN